MEGSIWKTTDGGRTFSLQYGWPTATNRIDATTSNNEKNTPKGPDIVGFSFPEPGIGYAMGRDTYWGSANPVYIYKTENGGVSWDIISQVHGTNRMCFVNAWHGFALNAEGDIPPYETFDGGKTWTRRFDLVSLT